MYLWVGQGGGAKGKRGEKRGSSITCARTQQEHPYVRENCKWNLLWSAFSFYFGILWLWSYPTNKSKSKGNKANSLSFSITKKERAVLSLAESRAKTLTPSLTRGGHGCCSSWTLKTVLKTDETKTHAPLGILTRGKYLGNFVVK